jgi:hypothetical protein
MEVVYKVDKTAGHCGNCRKWRWLEVGRGEHKICSDCVTVLRLSNVITLPSPSPKVKDRKPELLNVVVSGEKIKKDKKNRISKSEPIPKEEVLSEKEQRIIEILQNSENPVFATEIVVKLGLDNNRIELQKVQRLCIRLKKKKKIAISEYRRRQYIDISRKSLLLDDTISEFDDKTSIRPSSISKVYVILGSATKALAQKNIKSGLERQTLSKVLHFLVKNGTVDSYKALQGRRRIFYALKSNKIAMRDLDSMREQSVDKRIIEIIENNKQVTLGKITELLGLRSKGGKSVKKRLAELLEFGIITREPRILDPTSKVKSFFYFVKK